MVLRKIPVDPDTAEILTTCAGNRFSEEPLFRRYRRLNESFGKWTSAWFCRKYARIARKYGVDTTIYDIRHTVATILYYHYVIKEGKGPEMIKVILGHAEGSQEWKKYVHFLENRAASFDLAIDYTRSPKFYLNSIANISIPKVKS
jgi:integrase